MLSLLRGARSLRSIRPLPHIRHFAEEVTSRAIIDPSDPPSNDPDFQASPPVVLEGESKISTARDVPFVKVDERHGLWYFFREFRTADSKKWQRTTIEFKNQDGISGEQHLSFFRLFYLFYCV